MGNPNKIMDSLLVVSYKAGDKKALSLLVKRWNKKLCSHAYTYVHDWDLAKDVTQDTWSTIMGKIHLLRDSNRFGSWAMTITTRKALDLLKRQVNRKKEVSQKFWDLQELSQDTEEDKEVRINQVLKVLSGLPPDQKAVLKLFYLEEYSLKEIGEITGTSVSTVKTRLFRAREKIKEELKINRDEKRS